MPSPQIVLHQVQASVGQLLPKVLPWTAQDNPNNDTQFMIHDNSPWAFQHMSPLWVKRQQMWIDIRRFQSKIHIKFSRKARARHMASEWNASQLVNRLPPEILYYISQYVTVDEQTYAQSIIPLSHVCKYWHESITLLPSEWAKICNWSTKTNVAFSLAQSKKLPLNIWFNMDRHNDWFCGLIKPHIKRTASLKIYQLRRLEDLLEAFPDFPQAMPALCRLKISPSSDFTPLSDDPFKSFPASLKHLSLAAIPLYKSILKIRTLTKFTLGDPAFAHPLDTLLTFLEANVSLKHVKLKIRFKNPPSSKRQCPIGNQLHHLSLNCETLEDIKALISQISIEKGGTLKISCFTHKESQDALQEICKIQSTTLSSPTHMRCNRMDWIQLSGPNGNFELEGICRPVWDLTRLPPLFKTVQELHLQEIIISDLSIFPALQVLAIDYNGKDALCPLFSSSFLLSEQSSSLKTLVFQLLQFSECFMRQLIQFVSKHRDIMSMGLDQVIIICRDKDQFPSDNMLGILKLKEYVLDFKLRVMGSADQPKVVNMHW